MTRSFRIDRCLECGHESLDWSVDRVEVPYFDRARREQSTTADVPMSTCRKCGATSYPAESVAIRHAAVCRARGLLAPEDIVAGRKTLGMTQTELAAVTGLGVASIRRWELGTGVQNVANDRALRWAFGEPPPKPPARGPLGARTGVGRARAR
jgi:DNA-binding transcriptional regulator YiaG